MSNLLDNDISSDIRPYIMELQGYLRTIQRARYGSTTVPQDGYYGPTTVAAVQQFQQEEGLPPTGQVDAATWNALYQRYQQIMDRTQPPTSIRGYAPLKEGDRGDPVVFLHTMIGRLARLYRNLPYVPITNQYSTDTSRVVREIQIWANLPITGETDTTTWDTIATLYNQIPREALFE